MHYKEAQFSPIPVFTLHSGREIPAMALGTWRSPSDVAAEAVYTAIMSGYRHIDTAAHYNNEDGVGEGINRALKQLNIPRSEIFVTTKIWLDDFRDMEGALNRSLEKLFPNDKDAYVDLLLMHWPFALKADGQTVDDTIHFTEIWAEMEKLPESKARDIGISNFTIANTKKLLSTAKKTPVVNQVELHANLPQFRLVEFLLSGDYGFAEHDGKIIYPQAYCPLAHGNMDEPVVNEIAEKYGVSPANIVLSWAIERNLIVLPKSATPSRIEANFRFVPLRQEDTVTLNELAAKSPVRRYCSMKQLDVFNDNEDSK